MAAYYGTLDDQHGCLPLHAKAYVHGIVDYFGAGEAASFSTSDSEVLDDDETLAPPGYEGETWSRPLRFGIGVEVEHYRAGWNWAREHEKGWIT